MNSPLFLILAGTLALIGGVFALLNPLAATYTAERIAAWFFMFAGVLQIAAIFSGDENGGSRILSGLLGIIFLLVGVSLFSNPLAGIIQLTLLVAILFLAGGVAKISAAFIAGVSQYWPVAVSGALSVLLAVLIFANFPASAVTILGILLAIELISTGASLIVFGLGRRQVTT